MRRRHQQSVHLSSLTVSYLEAFAACLLWVVVPVAAGGHGAHRPERVLILRQQPEAAAPLRPGTQAADAVCCALMDTAACVRAWDAACSRCSAECCKTIIFQAAT